MIFVDTGVWFEANAEPGELGDHLRDLLGEHHGELVTSVPVLTELWALTAVRKNPARAKATCLDVAFQAKILYVQEAEHRQALGILHRWSDQSFSYADATSFALMARERIDTVASLDNHFRVYRYGRLRNRAFRVLD